MFRRISPLLLLLLTWILIRVTGSAAQGSDMWYPHTYEPGTSINLFSSWNGVSADEGFVVSLPSEWVLNTATGVRQAHRHVTLDVVNLSNGQYLLLPSEPLRRTYDIILQVVTSEDDTFWDSRFSIAPAVKVGSTYVPDEIHVRRGELRSKSSTNSGYALAFEKGFNSLHIQPPLLEILLDSHTLEFWVRTTALDVVILSTWNGATDSPYPIEFMIDPQGRMRYYRNTIGHHVTLATESPVADGTWHHVALVYDAETDWTQLYIDGSIADSLLDPAGIHLSGRYPVALGGRVGELETEFVGELDELRLWPAARTALQIHATMQQESPQGSAFILDFESRESFRSFREGNAIRYRIPGGPSFGPLVHSFRGIAFDEGVTLTWEDEDPRSEAFLIERSEDGLEFEGLTRIKRSSLSTPWSYTDLEVPNRVVFYRLIQETRDRPPRMVGTIKLGLAPESDPPPAEIVGNYPNPFNPRTSITYEIRESQHLKLSIIDLSGHLVAVLVDRQHEPGTFETSWDANELPSGTYFVRLQGLNGTVQTRQILLTK
ncbi:MAG: T9SS type A sorting domain-containing protein [Bacteroidetes bacterium]|nr:T9SS type A sorting domain-containing protein [Bacteroidota bacterium]